MRTESPFAQFPHRLLFAVCALAASIVPSIAGPAKPVVRDHYIDVRTYADYNRRPWPMPGWHTFGDRVQLVGNRYVSADRIAQGGGTGRVFRPNYDLVRKSAESFSSLLSQLSAADPPLFVWNLGGYIPNSRSSGYVTYDYLGQMIDSLGERFLGSDIGEQDGRYHNVYKSLNRLTADPFEEYLKLHRFQLRIAEDHADKASLLTVMYNWHGTLRDGLVVSAAAECQNKGGVTNPQVQYAFLRGATRQFGVSLAGDLAVFSSWDSQRTSTALRRRYLFSQYQWNCAILSCEDAYGPSPIVNDFNTWMNGFLDQHPRPGPTQCPVAFLTDPFQGWIPGMALSEQFKKHVAQAYQPGDFLTHLLFDTVYPRYSDNGMWKDESRAMSPTPYGDLVEVVTSDCPAPVMDGYGVMILASDLPTAGRELRDKLEAYAGNGGHVVVTAANAKRLWPEWGIGVQPVTVPANSQVTLASGGPFAETLAFDVLPLDPSGIPGAVVSASAGGVPLVIEVPLGEGRVTLLASAYGLNRDPSPAVSRPYPLWNQSLDSSTEQVQPYVFPEHVRRTMDGALKSQQLFSVGNDQLAFITNRVDANNWLVGIYNSQLTAQSFQLQSQIGAIQSVEELPLDNLATSYPFLPPGYSGDGVPSDASRVAAGDVRFFKVSVDAGTEVRVAAPPTFPALPSGRFLRMPTLADLDRSLIRWPTFFQHFDGVIIDWTEFRDIDADALKYDLCRWMNRQRLRFVIDCRNEQAAALDEIAAMKDKLLLLDGARDLLFSSDNAAQVARINAMAADPAMSGFHFRKLPSTQQGILRDPVNLPGIEILDLIHNDWEAVYANVRAVFGSGSPSTVAGTPVDRTTVSGTASPLRPNLFLSLRDPGSVERALNKFDPVWKNFAGVKLESDLVWRMSEGACTRLGQALQQRGLKVIVDYSDHLEGWTGVTFQNLDADLRSPEIGAHVRSERVFANIAAKLPLLGASDVLIVESMATDLVDEAGTDDPQVAANRAVLEEFCQRLRNGGVTVHLWHRPHRELTSTQARALIDSVPDMKAAINLNANANIAAGLSWAGNKLGMAVLGSGTTALAQRNAITTSSDVDALMYAPLSLSTATLAGLPNDIPWVLDGDYQNASEVAADLTQLPGTTAPLKWDADPNQPGIQDGSGTWSNSSNTWWAGTTAGPWQPAAHVAIGNASAVAGTITLGQPVTAGSIYFLPAASGVYRLVGSTLKTGSIVCVADAVIASVIIGTTGLNKSGAGKLSLTGVSTYSGGTVIDGGTLSLESSTTDTAIRGAVTVNSGGTLRIAGANSGGFGANSGKKIDTLNVVGGTVNNTLTTSSIRDATVNMTGGTISGGEINWRNTAFNSLASATTATVSSRIMIRPDYASPTLTINVADGAAATDLLISGIVKQSIPSGNLVKTGDGTLELSAQNTYTGNTTVAAGTLRLQLPKLADTSTLTIGTIAGSPAVLDLPNSGTDVVAALIIDGTSRSAGVYNSSNSGGAITGNGSIEVAASPAYLAWAATNGLGGSSGKDPSPAADPDGDGAMNLAEYGLGTIPNDPSSFPVCTSDITNNRVTISFLRARTDVIYTVEGSSDLSVWIPVAVDPGLVGQTVKTSDAFDLPASGKRFLRLRMTQR